MISNGSDKHINIVNGFIFSSLKTKVENHKGQNNNKNDDVKLIKNKTVNWYALLYQGF